MAHISLPIAMYVFPANEIILKINTATSYNNNYNILTYDIPAAGIMIRIVDRDIHRPSGRDPCGNQIT